MPKPDEASLGWFDSLVPDAPGVQTRPMFGNKAAFVNGNMFLALFGEQVAVRLSPEDQEALLEEEGASKFEPMPGRAMKEYVTLPEGWRDRRDRAEAWVDRSFGFVAALPPKEAKTSKKK